MTRMLGFITSPCGPAGGPTKWGGAKAPYKRFAEQNLGARANLFRPRKINKGVPAPLCGVGPARI